MIQSPETILSSELGPGERLLWSGRPRLGIRIRSQDVFLIPFSLLWGGFACFWELMALTTTSKAPGPVAVAFPLFGIPFVLVGFYMIFGRFLVDARARARTSYGVTNERILIVGGLFGQQTKSLQLRAIPEVTLTERGDGSGTITFGTAIGMGGYNAAMFWPLAGRGVLSSFEFIDRVSEVYEIIRNGQRAASA